MSFITNKNLLAIVLLFSLPYAAYAMKRSINFDGEKTIVKKSKDTGYQQDSSPIMADNDLGFELALHHGYIDAHHDICVIAQINKRCRNWVIGSSEMRKKWLNERDSYCAKPSATLWHGYGSVGCFSYFYGDHNPFLGRFCLRMNKLIPHLPDKEDSNLSIDQCNDLFAGYESRAVYFPNFLPVASLKSQLFFADKELCVYGCRKINNDEDEYVNEILHIVRYSLDGSELICAINSGSNDRDNKPIMCGLINFIEYPALLKAILDSKMVTKKDTSTMVRFFMPAGGCIDTIANNAYLEFDLAGVTLPKDYKKRDLADPFLDGYPVIKSFTSFPLELRRKLDSHYENQAKNQKGLMS